MIDYVTAGLIYGATVAAIVFPILYGTLSNWRATLPGRALMQLAVSTAVVLALNTIAVSTANEYPFRDVIRFVAYLFLSASLWRQVFVLRRYQQSQRDEIEAHEREEARK